MSHVRTQQQPTIATLEDGQIWIWNGQQLEVRARWKIFSRNQNNAKEQKPVPWHSRVAKQFQSIKTVLKFLQDHQAVLGPSAANRLTVKKR